MPIVTLGGSELEGLLLDTLDLNDQTTWGLESLLIPPPSKRLQRLSAPDADSDLLAEAATHDLRTVTARVRYEGGSGMDGALVAIGEISQILQRAEELEEGIPLTWTPAEGTRSGTLYVQSGEITEMPIELDGDNAGWLLSVPKPVIAIRLDCFPFIHDAEVLAATASGSGRILSVEVPDIEGDVPALARLVLTDTGSQDRRHIEVGGDRYGYDSASPSDLDILATEMTALAGSLSGSYITLDVSSSPIALAEASALPHTGPHKLRAQVERTAAADNLYVRAAVRTVDGGWKRTPWKRVPALAGKFEVELGDVDFPVVVKGTQASTIRFEAYSDTQTVCTCRLYRINPIPTEVVYALMRSKISSETPTAFDVFDQFNQSAGALAGKTAQIGGTWAGSGDSDDFAVETTGKTAQRTAVSDAGGGANNGRFGIVGASVFTDVIAQVDVKVSARPTYAANEGGFGVVSRYVSTSNYIAALMYPVNPAGFSAFAVVIGGVPVGGPVFSGFLAATGTWYTIRLEVDRTGDFRAWIVARGNPFGAPSITGYDSALASGGSLASGGVGILDYYHPATANTRSYDNLVGYPPVEDVPMHSGRKLELASRYAIRENAGGTGWAPLPLPVRGRYLFLPPAGPEDLPTRLVIKDRLTDVDNGVVDGADTARSASVYVIPRRLVVP